MTAPYHIPVMGPEVVHWLVTDPQGDYADFTVGGGGHSQLILDKLDERGRLCGIDRDADAIAAAKKTLPNRIRLWNIRFSEAQSKLSSEFGASFSGILMDLGVSSHQLDESERGFSYRFEGPLDLRMTQDTGETAAGLLARLSEADLRDLLLRLGEEPQASRIAKAVIRARGERSIDSTGHLAEIIRKSVPATAVKSLPRVFQALRMAVNREIEELELGLEGAWGLLRPAGRLVVLSYHSLEDRPVKRFMQALVHPPPSPLSGLLTPAPTPRGKFPIRGPLLPSSSELNANPRSRSAKLRVIEKLS